MIDSTTSSFSPQETRWGYSTSGNDIHRGYLKSPYLAEAVVPSTVEDQQPSPSKLFLAGKGWVADPQALLTFDALEFTNNEQRLCKSAFDQLCVLAQQGISSWRCESEIGVISADWSVKKQAAGRAFLRSALLEFLESLTEVVPESERVYTWSKTETITSKDFEGTANRNLDMRRQEEITPRCFVSTV
ncbi:hypothetical protein ACMFMG_006866 [Clarireedia jacksonii]